jgi:hypothetical protein
MRSRSARKSFSLAVLVAFGTGVVYAAAAPGPDPNELFETARKRLAAGDLESAGSLLADLRQMVSTTPEWDPDGMFAGTLLPQMEARLGRLRMTLEDLQRLVEERQMTVRPPQAVSDDDILPKFTGWARTTIQEIRTEAEAMVAANLPDPADRAILTRTEDWATVERRLEAMVLRRMAESLQRELDRIFERDERSDAMQTRLDVVKRSTVDLAVERGQLQDDLKECQDRLERERGEFRDQIDMQVEEGRENLVKCRQELDRYIRVLSEMLLDENEPAPDPEQYESDPVGSVFATVLEQDLQRLRTQQSQSPQELARWRRNLGRYRHYNRVLTSARVAADQGERIGTLEAALNEVPIEIEEPTGASTPIGRIWLPLAILTLATAVAGWWLGRRGRRAEVPVRRDRQG